MQEKEEEQKKERWLSAKRKKNVKTEHEKERIQKKKERNQLFPHARLKLHGY